MILKNKGLISVLILSSGIALYLIYILIIRILHAFDRKIKARKYKNLNEAISRFLIDYRVALMHYIYFSITIMISIWGKFELKYILIGFSISGFGAIFRIWAYSYKMTEEKLIIYGPFAIVRHPRYLGNFIIGLGITLLSPKLGIISYYIVCFFIIYFAKMRDEEKHLQKIFGNVYKKYKEDVSPFVPIKSFIYLWDLKFDPINTKVNKEFKIEYKSELVLRFLYTIFLNVFAVFLLYLKMRLPPT